jgi:hypothetical protein
MVASAHAPATVVDASVVAPNLAPSRTAFVVAFERL